MTHGTRLRVASNRCEAGRPIQKRTCAQPVKIRVIPENEIPPALRVDIYSPFADEMQRGCPDAVKSIKFLGVFGALCDISHGIVFGG